MNECYVSTGSRGLYGAGTFLARSKYKITGKNFISA